MVAQPLPAPGPRRLPNFEGHTRQKFARLPTLTKNAGGGNISQIELPKTGYLARLWLPISITTAGTLTTQNPLGACSAIRRVKLTTNNQIDIFNISGAGYGYLLNNFQELGGISGRQPQGQYNSTLVTATTYLLDMVIPVGLNLKDTLGMLGLQNEQLTLYLSIEWETDANVILTGGGTLTGTCAPFMEFFATPPDPVDRPPANVINQIVEDQLVVSGAGDYVYTPPRGNIYLALLFGAGINAAPADSWNRIQHKINQNDVLLDLTPAMLTQLIGYRNNIVRGLGVAALDLLGSDGFGNYGSSRDFIDSRKLTDMQIIITTTGALTLYVVRHMLVPLGG
jgi:hypothetical protein